MADPQVVAVASGKGGVGKTTSAVNLGAAFVEAGRSVVVVDLDLGMANLGDFLDVEEPAATLHDVLSGDAEIEECVVEAPGGVDIVFGSTDIEAFGRADPAGMRAVVDILTTGYDVVVLDTGGGLSHDSTLPLGLADGVILVSTAEEAAVNNTEKTRGLVDRLGGTVAGVIVTRIGGAAPGTIDDVTATIDGRLLGSVPEDSAVPQSAAAGVPLVAQDRDSPAAQAYREIAYTILDEPLPRDWAIGAEDDAPATDPVEEAESEAPQVDEPADEPAEEPTADATDEDDDDEGAGIASAIATAESNPDSPRVVGGPDAVDDTDDPEADADEEVEPAEEASDATEEGSEADEADEPAADDGREEEPAVEEEDERPAVEGKDEQPADEGEDELVGDEGGDEQAAGAVGDEESSADADEPEEELAIEEVDADDPEEKRSWLSRLTGGLLG